MEIIKSKEQKKDGRKPERTIGNCETPPSGPTCVAWESPGEERNRIFEGGTWVAQSVECLVQLGL